MQNAETLNADQIGEFLKLSREINFAGQSRAEVYRWVERVLVAQEYAGQGKKQRGAVRAHIAKITGRSLAQVTRLIRMHRRVGSVEAKPYRRRRFPRRYTDQDIALLAEVDRAHERLSGPATRCILKRAYEKFGQHQHKRLAGISIAHLYNLRKSAQYLRQVAVFEPTRPSGVSIGERRRPDPQGRPGFLRVDTVHQGDWDGAKGVYHINAVDTVTQWQVVGCVSKISERHLLPVLEAMLHQFPFRILGFHADNGSEYINHTVAKLLGKLLIEFTRSRAPEPLLELSPSVRLRNGEPGCARQAQTRVQAGGLHPPVGEVEVSARCRLAPEREPQLRAVGPAGEHDERHRVRQEDGCGEGQAAATVQERVASAAAVRLKAAPQESCGNDGAVGRVENQRQVSHSSPRSLEISPAARDFHIPTAPTTPLPTHLEPTQSPGILDCGRWKWTSKTRIPTFPPRRKPAAAR